MHKNKYLTAATMILFLMFSACVKSNAEDSDNTRINWQTISANEAYRMMNELDSYVLLDVRTIQEFTEIRIDGAILIPDYEIRQRAEAELTDKNAVILIYCRTGRRSALSAAILAELGYSNLYDFGGIINWPYETVR
ncbi:MAG: rhodanese-like domain-containing protein [Treponema sp.]|nr:rhodanese-like domain-containing protein [Treponema sp.]